MTKEQFAEMLNGRECGNEITREEKAIAKEHGLVVVFGASDDLMEFEGAIRAEVGCWEGRTVFLDKKNLFGHKSGLCENCTLYLAAMVECKTIDAVWCSPDSTAAWTYKTDIPHATFDIMEDDELYCCGIVFELKSLAKDITNG